MQPDELWKFLPLGYAVTILIETPILLLGLSPRHRLSRRLFAGIWLTACTYPIVVLVLPAIFSARIPYLLVAETFAPLAECLLFWLAFGEPAERGKRGMWWDFAAITLANITSFAMGELITARGWWDQLL